MAGKVVKYPQLLVGRKRKSIIPRKDLKGSERLFHFAELALITPSVIHDIRSYITSIRANAEIGDRICEDDKAKEKFRKIVEITKRAEQMIESFRKLYKGEIKEEVGNVRIGEAIDFSIKLLSEKICGSGINLESRVGHDIVCKGELNLITHAFINLINNAIEAVMKSDKKEIRIWAENVKEANGTKKVEEGKGEKSKTEKEKLISVFIGDSGVGIDEKIVRKIFKPFFTTKEGGTGLGLYITKRIIESFGGRIEILGNKEIEEQKKESGDFLKDIKTVFKINLLRAIENVEER